MACWEAYRATGAKQIIHGPHPEPAPENREPHTRHPPAETGGAHARQFNVSYQQVPMVGSARLLTGGTRPAWCRKC